MYLTDLSPELAVGHILAHNLADRRGRKALAKGRRLGPGDLERLRALEVAAVPVAVLEPGDLHEDEAARRLGRAVCGPGLAVGGAVSGRVNLLAEADGVVQVDVETLLRINSLDGVTVATLARHSQVGARRRAATVKIIPFALPERTLAQAEELARAAGGVVGLRPLRRLAVGVVLVGSLSARRRIEEGVLPAVAGRIADAGSVALAPRYVAPDELAVAQAVAALQAEGAQLLIVAGETSVMDRDDVTPRGIRLAGGRVEHYGAPVEPGNLLLLAYLDGPRGPLPVVGAPGCVRSRSVNIVDLILPRLLAGELLTRADIAALGHGGLLG
jgi:molybdopterin biosynthesis enzyme